MRLPSWSIVVLFGFNQPETFVLVSISMPGSSLDNGALAGPRSSVDAEFCHQFISYKQYEAQSLLSKLEDVGWLILCCSVPAQCVWWFLKGCPSCTYHRAMS